MIKRFGKGKLTAERVNQLVDAANAIEQMTVSGDMTMIRDPNGKVMLHAKQGGRKWFVIKLTSKGAGADSGKYGWTRQYATDTATGWDDDTDVTGTVATDAAYEINLNANISVADTPRVRAWREDDRVCFQFGDCSIEPQVGNTPALTNPTAAYFSIDEEYTRNDDIFYFYGGPASGSGPGVPSDPGELPP
jgi:hypothetical protein